MDPARVNTPSELAACLLTLRQRRGLSLNDMERAAKRLPPREGFARTLPRSTVSDLCAGKTVPTDETLRTFLQVCGLASADVPLWLAAAVRARTADAERPRGALRVREVSPRSLGVHPAIEVPGATGELPQYVPRDVDERLRLELRKGSGFVLLVGSSSVGKTRCAYEGLLAELPDYWLFHPRDAAELEAFATVPTSRTVIWLDEIQRYLRGGLTASTVRALLNAVIVGTMWPDVYQVMRTPPRLGVPEDPFASQREVLGLASVMTVGAQFSAAEQRRAAAAATSDRRVAATWNSRHGMTQALAAAPELVRRWEAARDRYAWALITAAADARRMGVESPLSPDLIRAATPGYLTPAERAKAPADWFETAIGYAVTEVHGAASVLEPIALEMGKPAGYVVADFVHQHAVSTRRTQVPPETAWLAYRDHLTEIYDRLEVGQAAQSRKLYRHARRLFSSAGSEGLPFLAYLQGSTGRESARESTLLASIGTAAEPVSMILLAASLAHHKRYEEAIQRYRDAIAAGAEDGYSRLASLLNELGRAEEAEMLLREEAAQEDPSGYFVLAQILQKQDRLLEAEQVLRDALATGSYDEDMGSGGGPRHWLAQLLLDQGRCEDAETVWREGLESGDLHALYDLATHLSQTGRTDEAEVVWRQGIDLGEPAARYQLSWLFLAQERDDEALDLWREAIDSRKPDAFIGLARVLSNMGRSVEAERAYHDAVDAGEPGSYCDFALFLEEQDRPGEAEQYWRHAVAAGEFEFLGGLTNILAKLGRADEARGIEMYGLNPDGSIATPDPDEETEA